jgi:hypothetical protein
MDPAEIGLAKPSRPRRFAASGKDIVPGVAPEADIRGTAHGLPKRTAPRVGDPNAATRGATIYADE